MSDRNYNRRDYREGHSNRDGRGGGRDHYRRDNNYGRGENGYGSRFKSARGAYSHEIDTKRMEEKFTVSYKELTETDDIYCSPSVMESKCDNFDDFADDVGGLKEELYRGIIAYGFEFPSKIQSYGIPPILAGKDILAQAQSGSGKTGAFMISSLQLINEKLKKPQVIILSPTCDLAFQTYNVGKELSKMMEDVEFSLTVGGTDRYENILKLGGVIHEKTAGGKVQEKRDPRPAQIVVATPGRLKDIINEFPNLFDAVKLIIIDECDEMLLGNFSEDIQTILGKLQSIDIRYQMCLFSATLTDDSIKIAEQLLDEPVKILIKKEKISLDGITQTYIAVTSPDQKLSTLIEMLSVCSVQKFIVYVNSIANLQAIKDFLETKGFPVLAINSTMNKGQRAKVLHDFKKGQTKCLISTDLLSRGIDIQQLSLVINYDMPHPNKISNYFHRIGRTGRFGKEGWAINLADERELNIIKSIEVTFKCGIRPLDRELLNQIS